jgi:hypothetical protein
MSNERECVKMLREVVGRQEFVTFVAKVIDVDGATCTAERVLDGKKIDDVRLNTTLNEDDGIIITPKMESVVLICTIDGYNWFVSQFSEIDSVTFKDTQGFEITIKNGKISVKNSNYGIKQAFDELIDAIGKLTVTSPSGPS